MRKTLNENPVVQMVFLGILGIAVAFLFMTRVMGSGSEEAVDPAVSAPSGVETSVPGDPASAVPDAGVATAPAPEAAPPLSEGFEAGAGLPASVVKAYESGDVVALLVVNEKAAEDKRLEAEAKQLQARNDTTVFVVEAKDVGRYSRIVAGVDLDRVPALVAVAPKRLAEGALPTATVTYGFRGTDSLEQAVRDALYEGRQLPYHPG